MTRPQYDGPIPIPQPESDFYWEKCKKHELWLRYCKRCEKAYFYPRDLCPACFGRETGWIQATGKGTIYTYGIVHQIPRPNYSGPLPFVIAMVQLEEGPIMPTNLVDVEPEPTAINVGMPVEVTFDDITENISLPKFKPLAEDLDTA